MTPAERYAKSHPKKQRRPGAREAVWNCRLLAMRNEVGLTLRQVSEGVGITVSNLSEVERGAETGLTRARKLAEFFGTTVEEMWPSKLNGEAK